MSNQVIVTWGIHDGYAGGNRPQETIIDKDEFDGLNEEEKMALIRDYVQQDLEQMGTYISDIDWGEDWATYEECDPVGDIEDARKAILDHA